MSEGVKKVRITGGAELMKKRRGGGKTTGKTRKIGGEREVPSSVATVTDAGSLGTVVKNVATASTASPVTPAPTPAAAAPAVGGSKVLLQPKKVKVILAKPETKKAHVRPGKTRKVQLAIHGIHKNIAKAKTIKNKSKVLPLDEIKKELKARGLWKEGSKAPESMLRNIYADFQILKEKAL